MPPPMTRNPTTRMCEGCGQLWSSARFLDPTVETSCATCGGRVVRLSEAPTVPLPVSAEDEALAPAGALQ